MKKELDVRWGVAQRFEFIEWRAFWDGRLNRGDLEREFAISTPQASVDLRNYQAIAPGNIEYDSGEKAYVISEHFQPVFLKLSGRKYLEQLRGLKEKYVSLEDTWFSKLPEVSLTERLQKWPEDFVLRAIVNAINQKKSIDIYYLSLTKTALRKIAPHALVFDGIRWHARAWCFKNFQYRDFVLGRIKSLGHPKDVKDAGDLPEDVAWTRIVDLEICPHPDLDQNQKDAIAQDFLMEGGSRVVQLRACLAFYFVRRFNLDLRNGEISPQRAQISMRDFEAYESAMRSVGLAP